MLVEFNQTKKNCSADESCIIWNNGKRIQDVPLIPTNAEHGEWEIQIEVDWPSSSQRFLELRCDLLAHRTMRFGIVIAYLEGCNMPSYTLSTTTKIMLKMFGDQRRINFVSNGVWALRFFSDEEYRRFTIWICGDAKVQISGTSYKLTFISASLCDDLTFSDEFNR
ncbi:hypothetical protein RHMOL_Rhmol09G0138300 [Rhododendron molle]|uniref:Uncharacterized protein n=1 Tax=Rhododendron molle TaxID=49168 RepID=A0ACC0MEH0_RHOML|nr:hypothetical protein RHMOL_Rhmol09G0138300 [Rhododendron molle]